MNPIAVCIVEDLEEIREGLVRILEQDPGFLVLGAFGSAEAALEGIPEAQPDVVVMDINLPGLSGIDCVSRLRPLCPATQFTMFTIYENSEQVFEALAAGATGYLLKNTPPDRIRTALTELHAGGAPMSAHIARKVVASFCAPTAAPDSTSLLSAREREVLDWLAKGFLYKEIAARMGLSTGTVRQHIHHIYRKLHVQNRTEALNKMFGKG
ncbi:response regulator transcription factor [Flaviaesturariibacter amylovorans]|uniref:Response regulator transcription factor n=1 Tax=Flaviaesturariibacter amylovorans TaxID=1084520 RepID=A0ABP8GNV3_9BACT